MNVASVDRRAHSITTAEFNYLIGDLLAAGLPNAPIHRVADELRRRNLYPARDLEYRCTEQTPQLFISYDWRTRLFDLESMVRNGLVEIGRKASSALPVLDPDELIANVTFWIDFVFIDQSSRDLGAELAVLPSILQNADLHYIASPNALLRSWCCYETAIFNRKFVDARGQVSSMRSLTCPSPLSFALWDNTEVTEPADKIHLEAQLRDLFPGGIRQVELFLLQTSLLDEKLRRDSEAYPGRLVYTQTQDANEEIVRAAQRWYGLA